MELEDFFEDEFALYFQTEALTLVISTVDLIKNYQGEIDKSNPPKEVTLEVGKKEFADRFMKYVETHLDEMKNAAEYEHPATFVQDFAYDIYRGKFRSKASKLLNEWGELHAGN